LKERPEVVSDALEVPPTNGDNIVQLPEAQALVLAALLDVPKAHGKIAVADWRRGAEAILTAFSLSSKSPGLTNEIGSLLFLDRHALHLHGVRRRGRFIYALCLRGVTI
jgi:hypothetical protein